MLNSPMLSIFQHFQAIPLRSPLISLRSKWRLTGFSRRFTPKNPVRLHNPFGQLPQWGAKKVLPLNLIALSIGEGGPRQRRSGTLINDVLETLLPALFHTAGVLSAPSGHLPHRGRLTIRRSSFSVIPIAPRSLMIKKAMPINRHRLFDCQAYPGCIILEDGYIAMIQKEKW